MDMQSYEEQIVKFDRYPDSPKLALLALGLTGEAGEAAEHIKKYYRDKVLSPDSVAKELGDVLWYLTRLANHLGFSLAEVANMNLDKLESRHLRNVIHGTGSNR